VNINILVKGKNNKYILYIFRIEINNNIEEFFFFFFLSIYIFFLKNFFFLLYIERQENIF